jgi:tRNA A-37 threonylcarbamoyl transferase component Bud32
MNQVSRLFKNINNNVFSVDSETIVHYRHFYHLENWLQQRFTEKSSKKRIYILAMVALFFFLGGPLFVLRTISILLGTSTGSTGEIAAIMSANNSILIYYFLSLVSAAGLGTIIYQSQPTHLSLSQDGIRYIYNHLFYKARGPLLEWKNINNIYLEKPNGKTSPDDFLLCFNNVNGAPLKLKLGSIPTVDERHRILKGINTWATKVARDAEIIGFLEPPADHSYTELWLQALSAPPKREKLKPLIEGSKLKDGDYTVLNAIGVGGQGTAYLSLYQTEQVVLKEFILPVYVDISVRKSSLERFEREAKILQQLDHPQVVKLIDFFIEDHRGYLVLEHIDGLSLRQKVEIKGKFDEAFVHELAKQMCVILKYLHGLSPPVVHRDFTPDNLIFRNDGVLKLVDFNVAQQIESTATGTVVGKHAYLPPEQFRGKPTTQSDIYALGATLFYLLTGQDPEPISVSHPKQILPEISSAMDYIIAKATAINENDRYFTVGELETDLANEYLSNQKL